VVGAFGFMNFLFIGIKVEGVGLVVVDVDVDVVVVEVEVEVVVVEVEVVEVDVEVDAEEVEVLVVEDEVESTADVEVWLGVVASAILVLSEVEADAVDVSGGFSSKVLNVVLVVALISVVISATVVVSGGSSKVEGASELLTASFVVCFSGGVFLVGFCVSFLLIEVLSFLGGAAVVVAFGFFLCTWLMQDLSPQHWITKRFFFLSC